mmetsp:Transcript_29991/g.95761  ORF Transcript_29991/g.95761 Transcript_29991/m.95761 type:complete len:237 (+) Transcript_29991:104-814(+)
MACSCKRKAVKAWKSRTCGRFVGTSAAAPGPSSASAPGSELKEGESAWSGTPSRHCSTARSSRTTFLMGILSLSAHVFAASKSRDTREAPRRPWPSSRLCTKPLSCLWKRSCMYRQLKRRRNSRSSMPSSDGGRSMSWPNRQSSERTSIGTVSCLASAAAFRRMAGPRTSAGTSQSVQPRETCMRQSSVSLRMSWLENSSTSRHGGISASKSLVPREEEMRSKLCRARTKSRTSPW